jgi:hypothetical protein
MLTTILRTAVLLFICALFNRAFKYWMVKVPGFEFWQGKYNFLNSKSPKRFWTHSDFYSMGTGDCSKEAGA